MKTKTISIPKDVFEKTFLSKGNYAQQGRFNQPVPQSIGYTAPNLNTLPTQGYDFSYTNNFNPQPVENNTSFGQNQFSNSAYSVPNEIGYNYDPQKSFTTYNQTQNTQEASNPQNPYTQNSVNIMNPFGGISMDYAINFAGEGFGSGDYGKAAIGTGTALLKGTRNFLSGYSTGKENKRVGQEYDDKRFDKTPNYTYSFQQGGVKNSDIIAQNAITDQGQGNVNLEGSEFVMRTNGQVQPVVGDKHIENGKKADGVNAQLEDGDKVLSNYVKLKPNDIKELKDRYDISLKKGVTFADAQKKLDQKLGIKKLETEKADILEKIEKATKIKDSDTKQLSLEVLTKKTGDVNEKLNTLSGVRADNFEFLFKRQEAQPKLGSGTQLYDKNGKEITESKEEVAQQGMQYSYQKSGDKGIGQQDVERINKNTSIQFTPDFAKSYFSTASTPIAPKQAVDYSQMPVLDITSDGQWSDRKVWRNQRPEWFVGKQEPMEGRDYTTVPYKQWGEYQKGQEYQKFSGNNQQLAEMQQGGKIETLANKYGISMERAQELMSYQQGGEIPQEQEASQESQMQQVFQAVAEMLQQGMQPEQVAEQLVQMGVPEEQVGQLIQEVAQQLQGQSSAEEQMEGQYSNEQEEGMEVAQQGGQKKYYEEGGEYNSNQPYGKNWTKEDKKLRYEAALQQARLLGYEGKLTSKDFEKNSAWGELQKFVTERRPVTVEKWAKNTRLTAKHIKDIKATDPDIFKSVGVPMNRPNEDYSEEESQLLSEAAKKSTKLSDTFWTEGFNDSLGAYRYPMVATNVQAQGMNQAPQAQITAPSMARFYSPEEQVPAVQVTPQAEVQKQTETPTSGVRNIMPNFGSYIPLFSPMSPIAKETINIPRMDAIKTTAEPYLAEQERQRLTDVERIEQAGMSPQQTEALLAQGLASSQMASNDAIAKVEQYNAQNQFQADQYNLGARSKEDIMNAQFRQDYQGKALQTLANQEESMRNQYRSAFLQGEKDRQYIDQVNKANMMSDQFALVPGQGIVALNNKPAELPKMFIPKSVYDKMTAEEVNILKKKAGSTGMQLQVS